MAHAGRPQAAGGWPLGAYARAAPHPRGTVVAQDFFRSGLLPADTDFRVFAASLLRRAAHPPPACSGASPHPPPACSGASPRPPPACSGASPRPPPACLCARRARQGPSATRARDEPRRSARLRGSADRGCGWLMPVRQPGQAGGGGGRRRRAPASGGASLGTAGRRGSVTAWGAPGRIAGRARAHCANRGQLARWA